MRNLQSIIPKAIEAIENNEIAIAVLNPQDNKRYVDKEFNGYISSLGGSISSSGLLPSMIFYSQKGGASNDRPKVIKAIQYILRQNGEAADFNLLGKVNQLYSISGNQDEINRLTQKVEEAMIALKLAIRIYDKKPENA
jgi:hypothetical protein